MIRRPSAPQPARRITAAICTYQRYDLLPGAIRSALDQSLPAEAFEVIVIDNSPDADLSARKAEAFGAHPNLTWRHEPRPGLSNARNVAAGLAAAPLIAFLDDDARADRGWLAAIADCFDAFGEKVQVVGGRIRPWWGAARPGWLPDSMLGDLTVVDLGDRRRLLEDGEWVAGANIAFRIAALEAIGGFDTSLGRNGGGASLLSAEETAVTDRLRARGGLVAYDPDAAVEHWVDPDRLTQAWFRRRAAWQAVSDYLRDPKARLAQREASWAATKRYLLSRNPADRTLRGLALEQQDAGDFRWQVSAVYNAVTALLGGLDERDDL
ncbi:glycosyltransferase [Roseomonas sp. PWR1]|uniref:Glycosyltransferase n=1 Tax=Roseomonas nitratireducens TaxID=2820810 RepID=A0ABS4AP74_9PROT|nr:glycosyltransferase [Neoroseomonas nitratireducens]MBP0463164.1 glycosyltransferase [Neoroseomonas nitratireducens]